jgi:hypothetical protein
VANFGYYRQEWFYRKVLAGCGVNVETSNFVFIAVSVEQPHTVDCFTLSDEFRDMAEVECENALMDLAERTRSGNWEPKGAGSIVELSPPNYLKYKVDYQL